MASALHGWRDSRAQSASSMLSCAFWHQQAARATMLCAWRLPKRPRSVKRGGCVSSTTNLASQDAWAALSGQRWQGSVGSGGGLLLHGCVRPRCAVLHGCSAASFCHSQPLLIESCAKLKGEYDKMLYGGVLDQLTSTLPAQFTHYSPPIVFNNMHTVRLLFEEGQCLRTDESSCLPSTHQYAAVRAPSRAH